MTVTAQTTPATLGIENLKLERGFFYLATAYSRYPGGLQRAHLSACMFAGGLMKLGVPVYSPIAHSHPIAAAAKIDPYSHDFWLPVCRPMMEAAHGILVCEMPTWDQSVGIKHEIEFFRAADKPVIHLPIDFLYAIAPEWAP